MRNPFLSRACLFLIAMISFGTGFHRDGARIFGQSKFRLHYIKDIIAVPSKDVVRVYISDPDSGGIFYATRPLADAGTLELNDFKLLRTTAPDYPRPSGLAYWQQKLIVCDPTAGLFQIDLSSDRLDLKPLSLRNLLSHPEYVAVSDTGGLAVASDREIQFFPEGVAEPVRITSDLRDLDRLAFERQGTFLALDGKESEGLSRVNYELTSGSRNYSGPLSSEVRSQLPNIHDFAFYRGIYYVAGHSDISIFAHAEPTAAVQPAPLSLILPAGTNVAKIAVSPSTIYVADRERQMVLAVKRPVPILVDFPLASGASLSEQVGILEMMEEGGSLFERTLISKGSYGALNQLVEEEFFSELKKPNVRPDNRTIVRLAQLICRLNAWRCTEQDTPAGVQVFKEDGKIGLRNSLLVPAARIKGFLSSRSYEATGINDFETYLTGLDVMPLTQQTRALNAGELVALPSGSEGLPSVTGTCEIDAATVVEASPTSFPNEVEVVPEDFVNQLGGKLTVADLQKVGVAKIIANYQDVHYSKLKLSSPEKYKLCFGGSLNPDEETYVVDRVLSARSARYRFLDRKGKPIFLGPKEYSWFTEYPGVDSKEWSLTIPNKLNLGYVALHFSPSASGQQTPRMDYLKPVKRGTEVYDQQFTILTEAAKSSELLRALNDRAGKRGVLFYASSGQEQRRPAPEQSLDGNRMVGNTAPQLQLTDAVEERKRLTKLIHFTKKLADLDMNGWKVGVVENPTTIEDKHQCFFDEEGEWTWWVESDSGEPVSEQTIRLPGPINDAPKGDDHGTHVAAIIAARSVLVGLLPKLRLVKIDATLFAKELDSKIVNVQTFNLSTNPTGDNQALINKIRDNQFGGGKILLVIAAGEGQNGQPGSNYRDVAPAPADPVAWLRTIPDNVIVVGASTVTEPPARLPASAYSKKFVQLFAPGEGVFSATKGNSYAPASGTSQAAPQVTAAAILLRAKGLSPQWTKAVLIYTADWYENLQEQVWGGILNAERAYESVSDKPNSIWFSRDQGEPESVEPIGRRYKIKVSANAYANDPSGGDVAGQQQYEEFSIYFDNILRVERMDRGLFRIVYLEEEPGKEKGEFKMVVKAQINDGIRCVVQRGADRKPLPGDLCSRYADDPNAKEGLIPFDRVFDYVSRAPQNKLVKFAPPRG